MKQFKTIKLAALAAVLAISLVSAPVFAHNGEDDSIESSSATETKKAEAKARYAEIATQKKAEAKQKAEAEMAERKQKVQEKSAEQRKKVCEQRKKGIENKFSKIVTNAKRAQTRIDGFYTKAINYHEKNDITPTNWSDLVAAADTAKANSQGSIDALATISPSVDCSTNTVPTDIANFKAAAKSTRDNLKAYKMSVKDMLKALKDAKPSSETETEGAQ